MPDFHVIENVSETLVSVLTRALSVLGPEATSPIAMLHDLHDAPDSSDGRAIVAVTLVEVREDAASRNRPRTGSPFSGRHVSKRPPVALVLRYLLTPWSGLTETVARQLEQRMLGRIIQVLYDDAILEGPDLVGRGAPDPLIATAHLGLKDSAESLKVKLATLSFEEQTRFWHAVHQKYRPSLTYDVRVVNLDPIEELSESLVSSRELRYGVPARP